MEINLYTLTNKLVIPWPYSVNLIALLSTFIMNLSNTSFYIYIFLS